MSFQGNLILSLARLMTDCAASVRPAVSFLGAGLRGRERA